jgi:hypothetical protein
MRKHLLWALIVILCGAGGALAQPATSTSPAPQAAAATSASNPSYRLEFTLSEFEDGKKVNTRSYSMILQRGANRGDSSMGLFRVGSRVPVATGSIQPGGSGTQALVNTQFQYIDVGVNIDCRLWGADDDLTLSSNVEVSGMSTPREIGGVSQPVIRQTRSNLQGAITAGKPTMIASLDQVDSARRMEVSVIATKLK